MTSRRDRIRVILSDGRWHLVTELMALLSNYCRPELAARWTLRHYPIHTTVDPYWTGVRAIIIQDCRRIGCERKRAERNRVIAVRLLAGGS